MWNLVWPILLVILSNMFYHICSKSTPAGAQPMASLLVTYLVAATMTAILYFLTSPTKNLLQDIKSLNWTSLALGIAVVGLEFGYLQVYRAGWNISVGSLVANIGLAIGLVIVGVLLYHENVSPRQIIGIVMCLAGVAFISL